jgi:AbrB family looped-hinge helix DNA binding protein
MVSTAEDNMTLVRLRKEAQLTLPAPVRKALNVEEGDYLEAEIVKDGVLLKPVTIAHRKAAWQSVLKAAASVKDTKPKGKRGAKADEAAIVREIKAHRRKHA